MARLTRTRVPRIIGGFLLAAGVCGVAFAVSPFGVPISDWVVQGELSLPDVGPVGFAAREGTVITIQDSESSTAMGLSPALREDGSDVVDFLILKLSGPDLGTVEQFDMRPDEAGPIVSLSSASSTALTTPLGNSVLRIDEVVRGSFPSRAPDRKAQLRPTELKQLFGRSGGGICCVTCGRVTSCASAIQADCGACESSGVLRR